MDSKIQRLEKKIFLFRDILLNIKELSNSSTIKVGCIALKNDFSKIASFGYNGSYAGAPVNPETGGEEDSLEPGKSGFIHAEINMIAKFREYDPENYIILVSLSPCKQCMKVLINAGFKAIYWNELYRNTDHLQILSERNIHHGLISNLPNDYKLIKG